MGSPKQPEVTKVITVRLPKSKHEAIKKRVHEIAGINGDMDYSMNRFSIEALDAYLADTDPNRNKSLDCPLGGDHDWDEKSGNCRGCGQLKDKG